MRRRSGQWPRLAQSLLRIITVAQLQGEGLAEKRPDPEHGSYPRERGDPELARFPPAAAMLLTNPPVLWACPTRAQGNPLGSSSHLPQGQTRVTDPTRVFLSIP